MQSMNTSELLLLRVVSRKSSMHPPQSALVLKAPHTLSGVMTGSISANRIQPVRLPHLDYFARLVPLVRFCLSYIS